MELLWVPIQPFRHSAIHHSSMVMTQLSLPTDSPWSVTQVTRMARRYIEAGLGMIWVRGEIAEIKIYQSGHWYFTLKDAESQIRGMMWKSDAQRFGSPPAVGAQAREWIEDGTDALLVGYSGVGLTWGVKRIPKRSIEAIDLSAAPTAQVGMRERRRRELGQAMDDDPRDLRIRTDASVLRIGRYEAGEILDKARTADKVPPSEFQLTEEGYSCMAELAARALTTGLLAKPGQQAAPSTNGAR